MDKTELALTSLLILTVLVGFGLQGYQRHSAKIHPVVLEGKPTMRLQPDLPPHQQKTTHHQGKLPQPPSKPLKSEQPATPSDINTAGEGDLMGVPGIGPVTAQRIIGYRDEHGPFPRMADLDKVSGIGPSKLQDLKRYFHVPGESAQRSNIHNSPQIRQRGSSRQRVSGKSPTDKVNLNAVDAATLAERVSGIGPVLAERIIEERTRLGRFTSVEQIKGVYGIGEKRFEEIRKKVYLQ